jgi:sugar lactone lactonase YvrE
MHVSKSANAKRLVVFLFAPLLFMGSGATATAVELKMCPVQTSAGPKRNDFAPPILTVAKGGFFPQASVLIHRPVVDAKADLHECDVPMGLPQSISSAPSADVTTFPPLATGEPFVGKTKEVYRDNVPGNDATFNWITDLSIDRDQNLLFADGYGASREPGGIRKYDFRTGLVTTFSPMERPAICVDPNNNIYAMDVGTIDQIDGATGVSTHIANFQAGGFGGDGGPIEGATFSASGRWAVGGNMQCTSKGDLLILDWGNLRIRKIDLKTRIVTTVVGNGASSFNGDNSVGPNTAINPDGFTIDKNDNIFLIDYSESGYLRVRRVDAVTGITTTLARLQGVRLQTTFGPKIAVAPDGTIYMYDMFYGLMELDVANNTLIRLGQICGPERVGVGDGPLSGAHFFAIAGIQFLNDGSILVLEAFNQDVAVRKIGPDQMVKTIIGIPFVTNGADALAVSLEPGDLGSNIRTDSHGNMYFVDSMSSGIFKVDAQSHVLSTVFDSGCFFAPTVFDVDSNGNLVTAPPIDLSGSIRGLMLDGKGSLYAAELLDGTVNANIIERVNLNTLSVDHVAGAMDQPAGYSGDGGLATRAQFNFIGFNAADVVKMILDSDGDLLVSDPYNERVRKIDLTTGIVTTLAGTGTAGYSGDGGDARNAQLFWPDGLALDQAGNIYIGDTLNEVVRKVNRITNVISTVAKLQTRTDYNLYFLGPALPLASDSWGRLFAPSFDYIDQIAVFRTLGLDAFLKPGSGASQSVLDQGPLSVGYGQMTSNVSSLPVAMANFEFSQNGILISEAGIPAAAPTTSARVFVDFDAASGRNSGVAMVNTTSIATTINVTLTPQNGQSPVTCASIQLAAQGHKALFANQMNCPSLTSSTNSFLGTMTLTSTTPFASTNVRTANNAHGEPIFSALPVVDLMATPQVSGTLIFPQIVDGGGSPTEILLMNTSNSTISGTISIMDDNGNLVGLNFGSGPVSSLPYNIPSGGMQKFSTTGLGSLKVGYAVVSPVIGPLPAGAAVFGSAAASGGLASQAGILDAPKTTSARVYVERAASPLQRDTGIALVNPNGSSTIATVTLNLASFDGSINMTMSLSIPPNGHVAKFVDQVFNNVPASFQGAITISSNVAIGSVSMRVTQNQRGDTLYSTLPVADLNNPANGASIIPQFVVGGGFTTEIILLNTSSGAGTVHIDFLNDAAERIPVPMH